MVEDQTQTGLKEHLLSLISADQRQYLQPYYSGGVEEALKEIFYLQETVARALTLDNIVTYFDKGKVGVPTDEQRIAALINSGKLVLESKQKEAVFGPLVAATAIRFNKLPIVDWGEGLFCLELSWLDKRILKGEGTRLFEIGFCVNDKGDLMISKSQRNRLGHTFRGRGHGLGSSKDLPEKECGDNYLTQIHEETGLTAEAFGLLASIMFFGDKVTSGDLLAPLFEEQPQIAKRLNLMRFLRNAGDTKNQEYDLKKEEIDRFKPMTDFQAMLEQIGINKDAIKTESPFLRVPIRVIKMAMHKRFTDNEKHPNRYLYRGILHGLEQAKS